MVERALDPSGALLLGGLVLRTRLGLVEQWVVLLLFPAMAVMAAGHALAPLVVLGNEGPWSPVLAVDAAVVREEVGLPSEVLPVVSVDALSLVVLLVVWTPLGLEVEHVEVSVLLHLVDESHSQLLGAVSERAVVTVLALVEVLGVVGAVLGLVLLWMVHALHSVVRPEALFAVRAVVCFVEVANVWSVEQRFLSPVEAIDVGEVQFSSLVLVGVEVAAVLVVVLLATRQVPAFLNFEFG